MPFVPPLRITERGSGGEDRRGFTILEAVVALAIVGLAGVATLETLGGELRAAERAREAYAVAALAQQQLAIVTLLPAADLSPLPDSVVHGTFAPPFAEYRWTATVGSVLDDPDLYDVVIAVTSDRSDYRLVTRLYRPRPIGALP